MENHFKKMFAYNTWANRLFLQCLPSRAVASPKIQRLMSHILNAEEVWFCRLQQISAPNENIWKEYELASLQEKNEQQAVKWRSYLATLKPGDYFSALQYHNSKGQSFTTEVQDVLSHVINHGTYHRAQIAGLLRQENIDPPLSDFIVYVRQL